MIWFLRVLFAVILFIMLIVTIWASSMVPLWMTPRVVVTHPWFIATLFDTYFGFLTFFLWVAYKEASWLRSMVWFILIMLLGNIAMASYMLIQLFRVSSEARLADVLLRREK